MTDKNEHHNFFHPKTVQEFIQNKADVAKFAELQRAEMMKYADEYGPEYMALAEKGLEHEIAAFYWDNEYNSAEYNDPNETYYEERRNWHRAELRQINRQMRDMDYTK